MAAVLLRRLFVKHPDDITQIDNSVLNVYRTQLLGTLTSERERTVRRALCDAVSELARISIGQYFPSGHGQTTPTLC